MTMVPGGTRIGLSGTTVTTFQLGAVVEQALPGIEGEIGFNLDLSEELRANVTGGYFHFARDSIEVSGPKARLELSYADPLGWDGALLTFGGEIRHDDINDTNANGFVRLSIPLGSNPVPQRDLSKRARKLGRYVYRDVDIVVPTVRDTANVAPNEDVVGAPLPPGSAPGAPTAENEVINVFHVADVAQGAGDCTDAANACTQSTAFADPLAGPGDFFIPVDAAGNIGADFELFADLQSIVGAEAGTGSVTLLIPDEGGNTLTLNDLGGRATI